ncbi:MAG: DMT family transporter [Thermoguttaceae bacterium]|jgi:drug/metabolite transporter (DMT)-like permease|nr:DMT family transporter [Thermoguttaceae bacterium]
MASTSNLAFGPFRLDPAVAGTACCVVSALGYTGANICLRQLAGEEVSRVMTICVKELVAVAVVGPWLICRWMAGDRFLPSGATLALLVAVGLAVQLIGNLGQQFAFGVVGLAVAVPVIYCLLLTSAALLGRVVLGERIALRTGIALVLLLVSIVLLAIGVTQGTAPKAGVSGWLAATAMGMACTAGLTYALLTVTIRSTVTRGVSQMVVVFIITGVGAASLGLLSLRGNGLDAWRALPGEHLVWMLAAGTLNLVAFMALTKGLHLTSVVNVNLLNASQVAMAAIAGIVLFREQVTAWLLIGVAMTVVGMVLIDRRLPATEA